MTTALVRRIAPLAALAGLLAGTAARANDLVSVLHPSPADPDPAHWIVPAAQRWAPATGQTTLRPDARIVIARDDPRTRQIAQDLSRDLATVSGLSPAVVVGGKTRAGDIVLQPGAVAGIASPSREAYGIDIAGQVTIRAETADGLFYGTQSLLQLLRHDRAGRTLPQGRIADWPNFSHRMLGIDIGRKFVPVRDLDGLMRRMGWLKLNTIRLHFTDWPAFRLNSPKYPGLAPEQSYDRADVDHLEATAARHGITIIPEIDLPAHSVALIAYRPSLGFACPSMRQAGWLDKAIGKEAAAGKAWTVDITRPANRAFLRGMLDEFIPWFKGPYFDVGGDEYQFDADKVRCPELMAATKAGGFRYPGDVFVDFVNEMDRAVRAHGKTTVMWNWWRFNDDRTSIQPAKDIVVEVWNTPRLAAILADGYKVIVSPEERLYVSPGLEANGGGYGIVDPEAVYETMPFDRNPAILGYSVALWADAAEARTATYLLGKAYEPMTILAERTWSDRASPTINAFYRRFDAVGPQP